MPYKHNYNRITFTKLQYIHKVIIKYELKVGMS